MPVGRDLKAVFEKRNAPAYYNNAPERETTGTGKCETTVLPRKRPSPGSKGTKGRHGHLQSFLFIFSNLPIIKPLPPPGQQLFAGPGRAAGVTREGGALILSSLALFPKTG